MTIKYKHWLFQLARTTVKQPFMPVCCVLTDRRALPWGPDEGYTSCACTAGPHRSGGWIEPCPSPSGCSSRRWCGQKVRRPPHYNKRTINDAGHVSNKKPCKANGLVNLLLHHQDDVMAWLKGSVKLDEVDMVELVHHLNLIPHHFL